MIKKNYIIPIISGLFVVGVWCLYQFWWWPQYQARQPKIDINPHGCAVNFDYYWCEAKQRCLRNKDEDCAIEAGVKEALAVNYKTEVANILIDIQKQSARFAEGRVWLTKQEGEGNRWMAAKPKEKWEIVYDGQTPINCAKIIKDYELPPSVLQGFCD